MDKTIIVAVERRVHHRLYRKSLRKITKFKAHDEDNAFRTGDTVRIIETRPLSRMKQWRVVELVDRKVEPSVLANEVLEEQVEEVLKAAGDAGPEMVDASDPSTDQGGGSLDSATNPQEFPVEEESIIKTDDPASSSADQSDSNVLVEESVELAQGNSESPAVDIPSGAVDRTDEADEAAPRKGVDS
jgi:small subunit ribosomal protein S17